MHNFPVCCVQMLPISCDLPDVGAEGAEFASFAVISWSSLSSLKIAGHGCELREFRVVHGNCG